MGHKTKNAIPIQRIENKWRSILQLSLNKNESLTLVPCFSAFPLTVERGSQETYHGKSFNCSSGNIYLFCLTLNNKIKHDNSNKTLADLLLDFLFHKFFFPLVSAICRSQNVQSPFHVLAAMSSHCLQPLVLDHTLNFQRSARWRGFF